jgi:hypothetical protein
VDCRAEEGSAEETATMVGDHQPHEEHGKEQEDDWEKEEGGPW